MDSRTTQGTSRASMIILATVVFPEALPPPRPAGSEPVGSHQDGRLWGGPRGWGEAGRQAGGSPMAKASLDWAPCSLYQGGRPAV